MMSRWIIEVTEQETYPMKLQEADLIEGYNHHLNLVTRTASA